MTPQTTADVAYNLAQLLTATFAGVLFGIFAALLYSGFFKGPR